MAGITAPPDNFSPAGEVIEADGAFYPAISSELVRKRIRIGEGATTDERLIDAIKGGMISAMRALAAWKVMRVADGADLLTDVTEATLHGENAAEFLWQRAVIFYAAADIADMHVDVSATDEAVDRDEEKRDTADVYRRKAYDAIADLRAIGAESADDIAASARNRVELL